ncbi:MAG: metallophosphoesterase [Cellulosilyticaceae bacterium]
MIIDIMIIFIACYGIYLFLHYQNNALQVTRIDIKAKTQSGTPFKIVHLSDLHGKRFGKGNYQLYTQVATLKPDLVAFTGDLIDDNGKNLLEMIALLIRINKLAPVVYIPGNHEHRTGKLPYITEELTKHGVIVLQNAIKTLDIKEECIQILGIDDNQGSYENYIARKKGTYQYKDYKQLFFKLQNCQGIKLVLCHYPENFQGIGDCSYNQYTFDVMLSGHAHGGQFIMPFVGGLYAPGQGILPKYYRGIHGKKSKLIVSRGLGNSSFPFRLFNRPEIVEIIISG